MNKKYTHPGQLLLFFPLIFTSAFQQTSNTSWGVILLAFVMVVLVVAWLIIRNAAQGSAVTPADHSSESNIVDDLSVVEGIGPKITMVLQAAGINTFSQLAVADISRLQKILDDAGIRLGDPATWPEQARLAADGDWDGLKELQNQLKGGKR